MSSSDAMPADHSHAHEARKETTTLPASPDSTGPELADTLVCRLFAISLALHSVRQRLDDDHVRTMLDAAVTDLDKTIKDVRRLILTCPAETPSKAPTRALPANRHVGRLRHQEEMRLSRGPTDARALGRVRQPAGSSGP